MDTSNEPPKLQALRPQVKRSRSYRESSEAGDQELTWVECPKDPKRNSCGICSQEFKSSSEFNDHLKAHIEEKNFSCPFCNESLSCSQTLRFHVNSSHDRQDLYHWISTKFNCLICGQTVPFHLRQKHMRDVHFGLSCKICSKEFKMWSQLDTHAKTDHPNQNIFSCPICDRAFALSKNCKEHFERVHQKLGIRGRDHYPRKNGLQEPYKRFHCDICETWLPWHQRRTHMAEYHISEKSHICKICTKEYKTLTELDAHVKADHPGERPFSCSDCGKTFAQAKYRREHMTSVHLHESFEDKPDLKPGLQDWDDTKFKETNREQENYFCESCPSDFKTLPELRVHTRTNHPTIIQCSTCNKIFSSQGVLKRHVEYVHEGSKKCPMCGIEIASSRLFQRHMETFHYEENGHRCQTCNRVFSTSAHLQKHESLHETETTRFECLPCGSILASADSLRHHKRRIHGNAVTRAFKCSSCDKAFSSKERRRDHVELAHKGSRNHLCHICSKALATKTALKYHIERIHFGEKSLTKSVCEFCGQSYASRSHFSKHLLRRHPQHLKYSCQFCVRKFTSDRHLKHHVRVKHPETLTTSEPIDGTPEKSLSSSSDIRMRSISSDQPAPDNTNVFENDGVDSHLKLREHDYIGESICESLPNCSFQEFVQEDCNRQATEVAIDDRPQEIDFEGLSTQEEILSFDGPRVEVELTQEVTCMPCDNNPSPLDHGPKIKTDPEDIQPLSTSLSLSDVPLTEVSSQPIRGSKTGPGPVVKKLLVYNTEQSPEKMPEDTFDEFKKTLASEFACAILLKLVDSSINCNEVIYDSDNSCAVITCNNQKSVAWFKQKIARIQLGGRRFRAWEETELPTTFNMRLTLPDTFDQLDHHPIEAAVRHFNASSCDIFKIRSETKQMSGRVLEVEIGPKLYRMCRQSNWTLNFLMGSIPCKPVGSG